MQVLRRALIVLLACAPFSAVGITYSAAPISAWVIEKDSGAPIAGVHVLAAWELQGGLEGGNVVGYVMVMETITSTEGQFSFGSWGPKRHEGAGRVGRGAPWLILFKPGFYPRALGNQRDPPGSGVMSSAWNEKKIEMTPFEGTVNEYARQFSIIDATLQSLARDPYCNWRSAPQFFAATQKQNAYFASANAREMAGYARLNGLARRCGSIEQYVEGHTR